MGQALTTKNVPEVPMYRAPLRITVERWGNSLALAIYWTERRVTHFPMRDKEVTALLKDIDKVVA